jgi:adenosylcobalamin-dependent ribonucleoside-triphosphate reductase
VDNTERLENWNELIDRVIGHQRWLWERAIDGPLNRRQDMELQELRRVLLDRRAALAGRTYWLGGTDKGRSCECSQFNCSFTVVETVHDAVDLFWLLLNGCGTGFEVQPGCLFGFASKIPTVTFEASSRGPTEKGNPSNHEHWDGSTWTIQVGDSAVAWAKALGKLIAGKRVGASRLHLDFSQIRGEGDRLRGYGWVCHGYKPLKHAFEQIVFILNKAHGRMLTAQETHDIINWLGTVLSTRRSAQIALCDANAKWSNEFISFKDSLDEDWHRAQSNNSLNFWHKPSDRDLRRVLAQMFDSQRGEPGIRNSEGAQRRCPWSRGTNPCAEILLPNKGFCNLVEVNLAHEAHQNFEELARTIRLLARANYRQTCVDLSTDPILQKVWHENNQNIRLCGVGVTGIAQRPDLSGGEIIFLAKTARASATAMADELKLPHPQAVTTVKPSGTMSKVLDCTEGIHRPLGRYIFNRVVFKKTDPLVGILAEAGYTVEDHPNDDASALVVMPTEFEGFDESESETAIAQLDRYLKWQTYWADHNVSATIYYTDGERRDINRWLRKNWDDFVAVSFLPRVSIEEQRARYPYLPQTPVSEAEYRAYVDGLNPVTLDHTEQYEPDELENCETGACPVR